MTSRRARVLFRAEMSSAKINRPWAEWTSVKSTIIKLHSISINASQRKQRFICTDTLSPRCWCSDIQHRKRPSLSCLRRWRLRSRTESSRGLSSNRTTRQTTAEHTRCTPHTWPYRTEEKRARNEHQIKTMIIFCELSLLSQQDTQFKDIHELRWIYIREQTVYDGLTIQVVNKSSEVFL